MTDRADGRAAWHRFALFLWELHEPLVKDVSSPAEVKTWPIHLMDLDAVGKVLNARLRSRLDNIVSEKTCCAIVPTAGSVEYRCLGHLCSFNQVRGERAPTTQIGARIGEWTDDDVALVLWVPKLGDARTFGVESVFHAPKAIKRVPSSEAQAPVRAGTWFGVSHTAHATVGCREPAYGVPQTHEEVGTPQGV